MAFLAINAAYDRPVVSRIDLVADLNAQDDDGHGWSMLADATDPVSIRPGAIVLAGNRHATASVWILSVDPDGQIHFEIL